MTEITQADRDAAAECIRQGVSHPPLTDIISGKKDHWFFVQAFARHRMEERAAIVAWLRHRLDDWPDYVAPSDIATAIEAGEHLK